MEAKVIELRGPGKVVITSQQLDLEHLQSDELAAETLYSAISPGTEIAAYRGDPPLRPSKVYPRVVGYCNVARIIATGKELKKYSVGDLILTFQSHRSAFICKEEKVISPVPPDANLAEASTTYLFHLGYNALLQGNVRPGFNVAIVGLGTLGIATAALAVSTGV